jgi:hypothetical protein
VPGGLLPGAALEGAGTGRGAPDSGMALGGGSAAKTRERICIKSSATNQPLVGVQPEARQGQWQGRGRQLPPCWQWVLSQPRNATGGPTSRADISLVAAARIGGGPQEVASSGAAAEVGAGRGSAVCVEGHTQPSCKDRSSRSTQRSHQPTAGRVQAGQVLPAAPGEAGITRPDPQSHPPGPTRSQPPPTSREPT